jgi:haloacetate dehalogenase
MLFGPQFTETRLDTGEARINLVHGGSGTPLLLLHGYPETHAIWHRVAPALIDRFHVVCPDLRGYGDSSKPPSTPDHAPYSKRAMAQDMVEVMAQLGHARFHVAGHDRGARVVHRLALDHPDKVLKACVMDIAPTRYMFQHADHVEATALDCGHFLPEEAPDAVRQELLRFFGTP